MSCKVSDTFNIGIYEVSKAEHRKVPEVDENFF